MAENKTGLPDDLKSGMEQLGGVSLDDVKVHQNSAQAGAVGTNAYTTGNNIHLGPGGSQLLGHELTHVVQQKQGSSTGSPSPARKAISTTHSHFEALSVAKKTGP